MVHPVPFFAPSVLYNGVYEYDVYIMLKFILMFDKNYVIKSFSTDFSDYTFSVNLHKTFFIEIALRIVENNNKFVKKKCLNLNSQFSRKVKIKILFSGKFDSNYFICFFYNCISC